LGARFRIAYADTRSLISMLSSVYFSDCYVFTIACACVLYLPIGDVLKNLYECSLSRGDSQ
jgi:hypothetical protein